MKIEKNFKIIRRFFIFLYFLLLIISILKIFVGDYIENPNKNAKINNIDIQATVLKDGNLDIYQTLHIKTINDANTIWIEIPERVVFHNNEKPIIPQSDLNENKLLFRLEDITNYKPEELLIEQVCIYNDITIPKENYSIDTKTREGTTFLKITPQINLNNMEFDLNIKYKLINTVVTHQDCKEIYYNFITDSYNKNIKNVNIDFYLPENFDYQNTRMWVRGTSQGKIKQISLNHFNFSAKNIKNSQYVLLRAIFPSENVETSLKQTNVTAKEKIIEKEKFIDEFEIKTKEINLLVTTFIIALFIYWMILYNLYEKDKIYKLKNIKEDSIFQKYNPLLAGCIEGGRSILSRDVIAVLLNLINKKNIELHIDKTVDKKEEYRYIVRKNPELENNMDKIESYIYHWFFDDKIETNGTDLVIVEEQPIKNIDFEERLKSISESKDSGKNFGSLNVIAAQELKRIGANKIKVPKALRVINEIIFSISISVISFILTYNGKMTNLEIFSQIFFVAITTFFVIFGIRKAMYFNVREEIFKDILASFNNIIKIFNQKLVGKKIILATIFIILISVLCITITANFTTDNKIILAEILFAVSILIILTDDLMAKNEVNLIEDHSKLNALKLRIEKYSLLKDSDIKQIVIWDKYLAYAVSFGIASKIIKKMKHLEIDENIFDLFNTDIVFSYVFQDDENGFKEYKFSYKSNAINSNEDFENLKREALKNFGDENIEELMEKFMKK